MDDKEKNLCNLIAIAQNECNDLQKEILHQQNKILQYNTSLVGIKEKLSLYKEELKKYLSSRVKIEATERDIEIQNFRNKYPDYCKNDKV